MVEVRDETGKLMNDFTGRVRPDERTDPVGTARTVTVALDTAQYQLDMNAMAAQKRTSDIYSTFNLLMRCVGVDFVVPGTWMRAILGIICCCNLGLTWTHLPYHPLMASTNISIMTASLIATPDTNWHPHLPSPPPGL